MIFPSLRVTADAEGGLKNRALVRPVLQGFGGGQPPTSKRRVYTGALLAATATSLYGRIPVHARLMKSSYSQSETKPRWLLHPKHPIAYADVGLNVLRRVLTTFQLFSESGHEHS